MPDEPRIAPSRGNNQKSRYGIHSVSQTLARLKDPIGGSRHTVQQRRLKVRVYVMKLMDSVEQALASRWSVVMPYGLVLCGRMEADSAPPRSNTPLSSHQ